MKKVEENTELLICTCSSTEHQIIVRQDEDDNEMYCHIMLNERSFWKRLTSGVKYIFGYKCKYGHFEEFMLGKEHVPALNRICYRLAKEKKSKEV